jgi:hypothetical protein
VVNEHSKAAGQRVGLGGRVLEVHRLTLPPFARGPRRARQTAGAADPSPHCEILRSMAPPYTDGGTPKPLPVDVRTLPLFGPEAPGAGVLPAGASSALEQPPAQVATPTAPDPGPVAPPSLRRRVVLPVQPAAQMSLDLPGDAAPDLLAATCGLCLAQSDECEERDCRYALPGVEFQGRRFFCAVDVASSYPHGLPPLIVASLMGEREGEVQRIEKTVARRHLERFGRLRAEHDV